MPVLSMPLTLYLPLSRMQVTRWKNAQGVCPTLARMLMSFPAAAKPRLVTRLQDAVTCCRDNGLNA